MIFFHVSSKFLLILSAGPLKYVIFLAICILTFIIILTGIGVCFPYLLHVHVIDVEQVFLDTH